jgi:hypothetical protein
VRGLTGEYENTCPDDGADPDRPNRGVMGVAVVPLQAAVVAGEVKQLAQQTAEATEDITTRVGSIQRSGASAARSSRPPRRSRAVVVDDNGAPDQRGEAMLPRGTGTARCSS